MKMSNQNKTEQMHSVVRMEFGQMIKEIEKETAGRVIKLPQRMDL